jgi:nucleoside-diphosphate-sugar epimerase
MTTTLVTGALGCLGAWVTALLAAQGERVVAHDLGPDPRRLRLIASPSALERVTIVQGDVTDLPGLERVIAEHGVTGVVHLAALQAPYCAAEPVLGAHVNVVGAVAVFEAVRRAGLRTTISYASSAAAAAAPNESPSTLYGVYKLAAEGVAQRYAADFGVASIGLRPACVFGPGRDRGTTAAVTEAIVAAGRGETYRIPFATPLELHYVQDVAHAFIAAARSDGSGGVVRTLPSTQPVAMVDLVSAIDHVVPGAAALLSVGDDVLPFPGATHGTPLEMATTSLEDGIRATVALTRQGSA